MSRPVVVVVVVVHLLLPLALFVVPYVLATGTLSSIEKERFMTTTPPCCSDLLSSLTCRRLNQSDPILFQRKCQDNADFALLQCCQSCGPEEVKKRYEVFFDRNEQSPNCFDRHSTAFCERFFLRQDVWGRAQWSCSGQYAHVAFRICRKTCGFCRNSLYRNNSPVPCGQITPADRKIFYGDVTQELQEDEHFMSR